MSLSETEGSRSELGRRILDEALVGVGQLPAALNPDVYELEPIAGLFPVFRLAKPGSASITIQWGTDLEVAIGPFSEFLVYALTQGEAPSIRDDLAKLFRAEVQVGRSLLSHSVQLFLQGEPLWGRATYVGVRDSLAAGRYRPFAE